jgi:imidazolonepropionase-like amidohydrolase
MSPARAGMRIGTLAVAVACALMPAWAADRIDLLVRGADVLDIVDGHWRNQHAIAIDDGRIVAVLPDAEAGRYMPERTLDARGKYAIPALWDMHVHFGGGPAAVEDNLDLLPLYLAHGITGVRDAAGDLAGEVLDWRDDVARGERPGPRIFTSGPKIEGRKPIWKGVLEVGSAEDLTAALDRLQAMQVDFVKITDNTLDTGLFLETLRETDKRGLTTSAHVPYRLTIDDASAAGLDSIEHLDYLFKAGSPLEAPLGAAIADGTLSSRDAYEQWNASFDPERARATYRRLAERGTVVVPTLNGSRVVAYLDQDDHRDDAYLKYIGPELQATYAWRVERAGKDSPEEIARRHRRFETVAGTTLPLLQEAGVVVLAGTDAGYLNSFNYPGIGLHDELGWLVRYGITPLNALRGATIHGARFLKQQRDYGSLDAGKIADILLLDADPVADITATRRIHALVKHGAVLDRAQLDGMLDAVAARVAQRRRAASTPD